MNDHQVQIIEKFSNSNYLLAYNENDDLGKIIKKAKKFKPEKYISNTDKMITIIEDFIDNDKKI